MKKNLFSRIPGLLIVMAMLGSLLCTPAAALSPLESDNRFDNNYGNYAQTIDSYLYENDNGGLTGWTMWTIPKKWLWRITIPSFSCCPAGLFRWNFPTGAVSLPESSTIS